MKKEEFQHSWICNCGEKGCPRVKAFHEVVDKALSAQRQEIMEEVKKLQIVYVTYINRNKTEEIQTVYLDSVINIINKPCSNSL